MSALARELGVEGWRILAYLFELGHNSNSVGALADKIREHFRSGAARRESLKTAAKRDKAAGDVLANSQKIPVVTLPFELLPPGTWDVDDIIAHYRKQADRLPAAIRDRGLDEARIERINSLEPVKRWVGTKHWLGYIVFEFAQSSRVALECPFKGNATYILSGDWQRMVVHPKRYVWKHFPQNYTRIIHAGEWREWIRRIRRALGLR